MWKTMRVATSPADFITIQKMVATATSQASPPGILYVNGFKSVMEEGRKTAFFRDWAVNNDVGFLSYDHFAHGQSSGDFRDATVGRWFRDLCFLLESECAGPQILVASSMGFWLSLLVVLRAKGSVRERVSGILGIAPSINFTERLLLEVSESKEFQETEFYRRPSPYSSTGYYDVPINLLTEGKTHCLHGPLAVHCPVSLVHGLRDPDVPYRQTLALMTDVLQTSDVDVLLVKDGDHRLSRDSDLQKIAGLLNVLVHRSMGGQE